MNYSGGGSKIAANTVIAEIVC